MTIAHEPSVTYSKDNKLRSYTRVVFEPDLSRFNLKDALRNSDSVTAQALRDTLSVMQRRAVDIAGCLSGKAVRVTFNGAEIPVNSFVNYAALFDIGGSMTPAATSDLELENADDPVPSHGTRAQSHVLSCSVGTRWDIAVCPSRSGAFEHMSFVNSVWTSRWV